MTNATAKGLRIGWASADITPQENVLLAGQFHARVSEGVLDPVTSTALVLDAEEQGRAILVSCDLVAIPDSLRDAVRDRVRTRVPELDPMDIFLNATHTHAAPEVRVAADLRATGGGNVPTRFGVAIEELGVMHPADYVALAADRIAGAIANAWASRQPGGIGFGLGQALVGRNRRIAYANGEARMYGLTNSPDFSHVEGCEDHDVNLLCTYAPDGALTGLVVNLACPSQVSEHSLRISADYWHDTRAELRKRFGAQLFILPQNSASGDQSPHVLLNQRAGERMLHLKGLATGDRETHAKNLGYPAGLRKEIALRIADTVAAHLPAIAADIQSQPAFAHRVTTAQLARRTLTPADVDEAMADAATWEAKYNALRAELDANPDLKKQPHWYMDITKAYRRLAWYKGVADRFELEQREPRLPVEIHCLRLGDMALATNPFELYVDFGLQIKARSPAAQTFLVQHVGSGTYLPSARAVAGKSYGAVPASTPVGPEGGRDLVEHTLDTLKTLWRVASVKN